jgi:cytidine deaminase
MNNNELYSLAVKAMEKSYSPYSSCKVGAALLTEDGKVYTGTNIENAAFSPTVCAERVAFFKAISEGEKKFLKIAVAGGKNGEINGIFAPCGVCRQVMREFCHDDFTLILGKSDTEFDVCTLKDLLPLSFSPKDVK